MHLSREWLPSDGVEFGSGGKPDEASFLQYAGLAAIQPHCWRRTKVKAEGYSIVSQETPPGGDSMKPDTDTASHTIAGHNHELLDEIRNYHRDEDFRIVKQRDDLVSALRYAIMMRLNGKPSLCQIVTASATRIRNAVHNRSAFAGAGGLAGAMKQKVRHTTPFLPS